MVGQPNLPLIDGRSTSHSVLTQKLASDFASELKMKNGGSASPSAFVTYTPTTCRPALTPLAAPLWMVGSCYVTALDPPLLPVLLKLSWVSYILMMQPFVSFLKNTSDTKLPSSSRTSVSSTRPLHINSFLHLRTVASDCRMSFIVRGRPQQRSSSLLGVSLER